MVSRSQLARVAAVVAGVALVGAVGVQFAQSGYTVHVEHAGSEQAVPPGAAPMQYENLSAGTQQTIQQAFRSPGDTTTGSAENRPPEFEYGDGQIDHYVVLNGEHYRVTTGDRGIWAVIDGVVAYALLAVGLAAILAGGIGLYRESAGLADTSTAGD